MIILLFLKSCHFFTCHLVLRRWPFYMVLFLHFKITVALFTPMTWTVFICRPLTVRHEWSKKPEQGRYEGALLHPPCFLDRGCACCVHNCRSRFERTPPAPPSVKKKKTWGRGRGEKMKSTVQHLGSVLLLPPLLVPAPPLLLLQLVAHMRGGGAS